ncbi:MAG: DUF4329 domain-containing protein [Deltaproteobacteria bacterium]|nr:DUF4329 domain-containing protein [Deltaproteobacteria bacterium]
MAAANGAPAATATASASVGVMNGVNVALTTTWTAASVVPGGQPAANIAYTEGIKAATAAAASAVMSAMASISDMHVCPILVPIPPHGPGFVPHGSSTVLVGNLPAARQGDKVFEACGGQNPIAIGCPTVLIGDSGGGSGSGGGGGDSGAGGATGTGAGTGAGTAPRSYATAEEAAIAAMQEANPRSVAENLEYGGWVHRNPDGTYGYDPPTQGQPAGLTNMPAKGPNDVVWYHTHGATDPAYDSENFSGATGDKGYSRNNNATGYVATPTGVIKRYDPAADPGRDNIGRTGETTLPATAPP